jgi:hypothetical protein
MEETAFELKLMAGEVTVGIHRYRKRNPATRTSVKYDIQDEHGFF